MHTLNVRNGEAGTGNTLGGSVNYTQYPLHGDVQLLPQEALTTGCDETRDEMWPVRIQPPHCATFFVTFAASDAKTECKNGKASGGGMAVQNLCLLSALHQEEVLRRNGHNLSA